MFSQGTNGENVSAPLPVATRRAICPLQCGIVKATPDCPPNVGVFEGFDVVSAIARSGQKTG
jgi:hypothetical protein